MPGYSGTPLPKKLGIKPQARVLFSEIPSDVKQELSEALSSCSFVRQRTAPADFIMVFVRNQTELTNSFSSLKKQLAADGMLWVSWPKKTSGVPSDLDENMVRKIGLDAGLVDVKVCAVTDVWSGLKFVYRLKDRK